MRRPEPITETGILLADQGRFVLQIEGGGCWRLEAPRKLKAMLGQRVRIEGSRVDFDVIEVDRCVEA